MGHLSQHVEALVEEKGVLEGRVEECDGQLETKKVKRENVEADFSWLLKKGIVRVVDKLIESSKFTLGIKRMKDVCMIVGVEGDK